MATKKTIDPAAAAAKRAADAAARAARAGKPGYGPKGGVLKTTTKAPSGFRTAAKTEIKNFGVKVLGEALPQFKRTMETPPTFPRVTDAVAKARALFEDPDAAPSEKAQAAGTLTKFTQTRQERLAELAQWNLEQEAIEAHNREIKARIKRRKAELAAANE